MNFRSAISGFHSSMPKKVLNNGVERQVTSSVSLSGKQIAAKILAFKSISDLTINKQKSPQGNNAGKNTSLYKLC